MKTIASPRPLAVASCLLGAASLHAQEIAPFDFGDPTIQKNRLSIGAKLAFGLSAEIRNVGYTGPTPPNYDDGFVRTDISGNAGGKTWYWGYQADNQVSGDSVLFHTLTSSPRDGSTQSLDGDLMPGVELTYGRLLKLWPLKNQKAVALGAEAAISAIDVQFSGGGSVSGTASRTTSAFGLDGVVPPGAPYSGTYAGPGPLLNATASSVQTDSLATLSAMDAKLRSHVYGLRLGPFLEVPIANRFNLQFSAGAALMYANTTLKFTETLSFESSQIGLPPVTREQSFSEGEFLFGFYGRALASYDLNPSLRLFVGAEYMFLGDTSVTGGGKEATLKLDSALQGVIGVQLLF